MFQKYRRNSDSDLRDAERRFLSTGSASDHLDYLVACHRASLAPQWCGCGSKTMQPGEHTDVSPDIRLVALRNCSVCSTRAGLPVKHCLECSKHVCSGIVTLPDGAETACVQDLPSAPHCRVCSQAFCPEENCSNHELLNECHDCGKQFCDAEDCGSTCEGCSAAVCSECLFECERHNEHFCSDCTMDCEYCSNKCCPECVCAAEDCGLNICPSCADSGKLGGCNICDGILCENHNLECSMCEEGVCKAHASRCRIKSLGSGRPCGAVICDSCGESRCDLCNKSGCSEHFEECEECGDTICSTECTVECDCGKNMCHECYPDHLKMHHGPELVPPPLLSTPLITSEQPAILQVGNRVKHAISGLSGVVIKISEKDGIVRYIVEWDDDTAGKHSRNEIVGPTSLRRYFRN